MPETPAPDLAAAFAVPAEILTDKRGLDLLDHVLDFLRAHPERHDQTVWGRATTCGTTACVAGWADLAAGDEPRWTDRWGAPLDPTDPDSCDPTQLAPDDDQADAILFELVTATEDAQDDARGVLGRAKELLGLEDHEANHLFSDHRTFGEIEEFAVALRAARDDR